jgi:D-alanine-D-alanine ligase
MFPRMWAATGVSYPELVERLVASALGSGTRSGPARDGGRAVR